MGMRGRKRKARSQKGSESRQKAECLSCEL